MLLKLVIAFFGIYPIAISPILLAGSICAVLGNITEENYKIVCKFGISCIVSTVIFLIGVFYII